MATSKSVIPEIDLKIQSIPIQSQTRKLKARWAPELNQDLHAYHSLDMESNGRFSMKNYLYFTDKTVLGEPMEFLTDAERPWA